MERFVLAYRLKKFKYEIDMMPASELAGWRQFFAIIDKKEARGH